MRAKTHRDVEYMVEYGGHYNAEYFKTAADAVAFALTTATRTIDVLCWSREGAVWAGLADEYDEDPEASVTCRYRIDDDGNVSDVVGRIA